MLIPFNKINKILIDNNIKITGAFHLGAHDCEELGFYNQLTLSNNDVIWVDAPVHNRVVGLERERAVALGGDLDNIG